MRTLGAHTSKKSRLLEKEVLASVHLRRTSGAGDTGTVQDSEKFPGKLFNKCLKAEWASLRGQNSGSQTHACSFPPTPVPSPGGGTGGKAPSPSQRPPPNEPNARAQGEKQEADLAQGLHQYHQRFPTTWGRSGNFCTRSPRFTATRRVGVLWKLPPSPQPQAHPTLTPEQGDRISLPCTTRLTNTRRQAEAESSAGAASMDTGAQGTPTAAGGAVSPRMTSFPTWCGSSCYNKVLQTGCLQNNRDLFLTALEAECLGWSGWRVRAPGAGRTSLCILKWPKVCEPGLCQL